MARSNTKATGIDAFFEAIDGLTYREMRSLSGLLSIQAEDRNLTNQNEFAELLADAADSHFDDDEGED